MSCNGCRILRKGCSDTCILRPCLQWIDTAEAQAHATVFVAKFIGRAGLMSSISAVPENQRPALFKSLLFEAAGRTVSPVSGAVGLLWTGNWHVCQAAVETVLRGGALNPIPEFLGGGPEHDDINIFDCTDVFKVEDKIQKRRRSTDVPTDVRKVDLRLMGSPSMNSEESCVMTSSCADKQLLKLF